MASAAAGAGASSPRNIAVYVKSKYTNSQARTHFSTEGYRIVDETLIPEAHKAFSYSICRSKIGERYLEKAVNNADFIFYIYDSEPADVLGFATVNYDAEKSAIHIAVICSSGAKRGVGVPLLNAVNKVAPMLGADRIILEALGEKELTDFYKKRGYRFTAKRRSGLFPMEKNLTGTRNYNESLSYETIINEEKRHALENRDDLDAVPMQSKSMKYGIFVRYTSNTGDLRRLFPRINAFTKVSFDSSFAAIYDKKPADVDIFKTVEAKASAGSYKVGDPGELSKKIRKKNYDFIFYNFESDPTKPESFAFIKWERDKFIVTLLYAERRLSKFFKMLNTIISTLVIGSNLLIESTAIFSSRDTFEDDKTVLAALKEDHYKIKTIKSKPKSKTEIPYIDPDTGMRFMIGGHNRKTRRVKRG